MSIIRVLEPLLRLLDTKNKRKIISTTICKLLFCHILVIYLSNLVWSQCLHILFTFSLSSRGCKTPFNLPSSGTTRYSIICMLAPEYLEKLLGSLLPQMVAAIQWKGAHIRYWSICYRFVFIFTSVNELPLRGGGEIFFLRQWGQNQVLILMDYEEILKKLRNQGQGTNSYSHVP